MTNQPELSIILPCRNEEKALGSCLESIKKVIKENKIDAEIIVSDSSTDSSPKIALAHKVRLIKHDKAGYGNAYLEAFKIAKGKYFFLADADGTYDFKEIPRFLKALKESNDLVLGNRLAGNIEKGAMPWHHRYIGNPLLSFVLRLFFRGKIQDSHSGMRAITRSSLKQLNLTTTGMEFASEMIIKATKANLKIREIPIDYHPRHGESKLKSFSDGWRHLRFMLLYSPLFLFMIPGLILFLLGLASMILLYLGLINILGVQLFYHPMFLSASLVITGYQLIIFALFAKGYALNHLDEKDSSMQKFYRIFTLERASIAGIFLALIGVIVYASIFIGWLKTGLGALSEAKNSIVALTLIILGIQTLFSSFMLSILSIKEK